MIKVKTNLEQDMSISVQTPSGRVVTYSMDDILNIDETDLMSEFTEQSGTYAWWGSIYENEKHTLEDAKAKLSRAEAIADAEIREGLNKEGTKVTEALVKRMIISNEEYERAESTMLRTKRNVGVLAKIVEALDQRKDMLMMIGSHQRRDYNASGEVRSRKTKGTSYSAEELKEKLKERSTN